MRGEDFIRFLLKGEILSETTSPTRFVVTEKGVTFLFVRVTSRSVSPLDLDSQKGLHGRNRGVEKRNRLASPI